APEVGRGVAPSRQTSVDRRAPLPGLPSGGVGFDHATELEQRRPRLEGLEGPDALACGCLLAVPSAHLGSRADEVTGLTCSQAPPDRGQSRCTRQPNRARSWVDPFAGQKVGEILKLRYGPLVPGNVPYA